MISGFAWLNEPTEKASAGQTSNLPDSGSQANRLGGICPGGLHISESALYLTDGGICSYFFILNTRYSVESGLPGDIMSSL